MQTLLLTQNAVDRLAATPMQGVYYDTELNGFGLAISPDGVKTWIVWRRSGKRRRLMRISLGTDAEMTADEAREIASRVLAAETISDDNRERKPTVAQFARTFMDSYVRPRLHPATVETYSRILDRVIIPHLGPLRIDRVTRADLARFQVRAGSANLALRIISSMYGFAARDWYVPEGFNPARGMWRSNASTTARCLTTEELARLGAVLRQLEDQEASQQRTRIISHEQSAGTVTKILLLTGLGLSDLFNLQWDNVDTSQGVLHLLDGRGRIWTVALGAAALRVLDRIPRRGRFVIAGADPDKRRRKLKSLRRLFARADIADAPTHALRYTYHSIRASLALSQGRRSARPDRVAEDRAPGSLPLVEARRAADLIGDTVMAALEGRSYAVNEGR